MVRQSSVNRQPNCFQCLIDGHTRVFIKPIGTKTYGKLIPFWDEIKPGVTWCKRELSRSNYSIGLLNRENFERKITGSCHSRIVPKKDKLFFNLGIWNLMTSTSVAGNKY